MRRPLLAVTALLAATALLPAPATAQLCTLQQQLQCETTFAQTTIIINEFNRRNEQNATFAVDSIMELIFLTPITPATLNEFAFGDSDDNRATKNTKIKFQNTASLLPNGLTFFPAGTVMVLVGASRSNDADFPNIQTAFANNTALNYNPLGGDWNLYLRMDNSTYFLNQTTTAGTITQSDVMWIDRSTNVGYSDTSVSAQGFGLSYGGGQAGSGLAVSATVVGVGTPGNKKCIVLIDSVSCACLTASWDNQVQAPCLFGACNTNQQTFCQTLQQDPLLAVYNTFGAVADAPGLPVVVSWQTSAEVDNVGFHVYRALTGEEKALNNGYDLGERLTDEMIPAQGSDAAGHSYVFHTEDVLVSEGQFSYYIEDVDLYGKRTLTGPIPATFFQQDLGSADIAAWSKY